MRKIPRFATAAATAVTSALTLSLALPAPARAADFPQKPVTFIVPFAPGSTTDGAARVLTHHMARTLGQPAIIDNRVGAGGTIGLTHAARSAPDGYTVVFTGISAHVLASLTMSGLSWDPVKSFAPIGQIAAVPLVMTANKEVPAKTLAEFVAQAKAKPGELTYATLGPTTAPNLGVVLFMQRTGIKMREVAYKSAAQIYPDLVTGRVDFALDNLANALPFIQGERIRPLAVTTLKRMNTLPDVPTISEALLPDFSLTSWIGLAAPAGTPPAAIETLSQALRKALESPEYQQWLEKNGAQAPGATTPDQFAALIAAEMKLWSSALAAAGEQTQR